MWITEQRPPTGTRRAPRAIARGCSKNCGAYRKSYRYSSLCLHDFLAGSCASTLRGADGCVQWFTAPGCCHHSMNATTVVGAPRNMLVVWLYPVTIYACSVCKRKWMVCRSTRRRSDHNKQRHRNCNTRGLQPSCRGTHHLATRPKPWASNQLQQQCNTMLLRELRPSLQRSISFWRHRTHLLLRTG